jgi:lipopolysaccharide transport system permease protein
MGVYTTSLINVGLHHRFFSIYPDSKRGHVLSAVCTFGDPSVDLLPNRSSIFSAGASKSSADDHEIVPLTYVVSALFDLLIASIILSIMMAWYHVPLTHEALYIAPILVIEFFFASALALLFSALQVKFRDVGIAMPLLLQLWMFGSPVVYSLAQVPQRFRALYVLNPMAGIVENFRRVSILGIGVDLPTLCISGSMTVIILPAAYLFFKHREATIADII